MMKTPNVLRNASKDTTQRFVSFEKQPFFWLGMFPMASSNVHLPTFLVLDLGPRQFSSVNILLIFNQQKKMKKSHFCWSPDLLRCSFCEKFIRLQSGLEFLRKRLRNTNIIQFWKEQVSVTLKESLKRGVRQSEVYTINALLETIN